MKLEYILSRVLPEERETIHDISLDHKDYPYCPSCRSSETFCQCKGHNSCLQEIKDTEVEVDVEELIKNLVKTWGYGERLKAKAIATLISSGRVFTKGEK